MDRSGESMNPKDKHADWLLKPTANELADIQAFKTEELTIWERNTTATMLRQQQAEIEALKQIIDANNLNQNIGQFVKPTNEPVAWMDYLEFSDVYDLNVVVVVFHSIPIQQKNKTNRLIELLVTWLGNMWLIKKN